MLLGRWGQKIKRKLSWVSRPFMVNSDSPCSFLISELENIPWASSATPFLSKHLYAFSKNSSVRYEVFPQDRNLGSSSKPLTLAYVITLTKALTTRSLVYCDQLVTHQLSSSALLFVYVLSPHLIYFVTAKQEGREELTMQSAKYHHRCDVGETKVLLHPRMN